MGIDQILWNARGMNTCESQLFYWREGYRGFEPQPEPCMYIYCNYKQAEAEYPGHIHIYIYKTL